MQPENDPITIDCAELGTLIAEALEKLLVPVVEMEMLNRKVYLTEEEVAKLFSMSVATLQTSRSRGFGPGYIKDGRKVLYARKELLDYFGRRLVKMRG
jgi:hypothetical protein